MTYVLIRKEQKSENALLNTLLRTWRNAEVLRTYANPHLFLCEFIAVLFQSSN